MGHGALRRGELQPVLRQAGPAWTAGTPRSTPATASAARRARAGSTVDPRFDLSTGAATSRTASAGSSRSTRTTRRPPRSKHTDARPLQARGRQHHAVGRTVAWSPTWATTSAATTSTSSSRADKYDGSGTKAARCPQPDPRSPRARCTSPAAEIAGDAAPHPADGAVRRHRRRGCPLAERHQRRSSTACRVAGGAGLHAPGRRQGRRRPRWTAPRTSSPTRSTGKVYAALTNNSNRGNAAMPVDEANPLTRGPGQHRRPADQRQRQPQRLRPRDHRAAPTTRRPRSTWNLFLVCGDPAAPRDLVRRLPDKSKVEPDLLPGQRQPSTRTGNLWISTDGTPCIGSNDGALPGRPSRARTAVRCSSSCTVPKGRRDLRPAHPPTTTARCSSPSSTPVRSTVPRSRTRRAPGRTPTRSRVRRSWSRSRLADRRTHARGPRQQPGASSSACATCGDQVIVMPPSTARVWPVT